MKILLPVVVGGLILVGFVGACLAAVLSPSDYIMSQLVTTSETTTQTQTTQIYAIIVSETTIAPEVTTTSEALSEVIEE